MLKVKECPDSIDLMRQCPAITAAPPIKKKKLLLDEPMCRRLLRLFQKGISIRNVIRATQISQQMVRKMKKEYEDTGDIRLTMDPDFKRKKPEWRVFEKEEMKKAIDQILRSNCTLTLRGMREALERRGIKKQTSTIHKYLREFNYSRKKLKRIPIERNTAEKLLYRQQYCRMISQFPQQNLVFMDETAFSQHTALSYGWALRGEEPFVHIPAHKKQCVSLLAAVSIRGFEATRIIRGPVTNRHICEFMEHNLDHLQASEILVLDNARVHHAASVKQKIIQLKRPVRYLPAYTPQLNPIEHIFSEIKAQFVRRRVNAEMKITEIEDLIIESVKGMKSKNFTKYFSNYQQWVQRGIAGDMFI